MVIHTATTSLPVHLKLGCYTSRVCCVYWGLLTSAVLLLPLHQTKGARSGFDTNAIHTRAVRKNDVGKAIIWNLHLHLVI